MLFLIRLPFLYGFFCLHLFFAYLNGMLVGLSYFKFPCMIVFSFPYVIICIFPLFY